MLAGGRRELPLAYDADGDALATTQWAAWARERGLSRVQVAGVPVRVDTCVVLVYAAPLYASVLILNSIRNAMFLCDTYSIWRTRYASARDGRTCVANYTLKQGGSMSGKDESATKRSLSIVRPRGSDSA